MHILIGVLVALFVLAIARRIRRRHWRRHHRDPSRSGRWGHWINWRIERALRQINATDEQRTKVRAIQARLLDDVHAFRGQQRSVREELTNAILAPAFDSAKLNTLVDDRSQALRELGHRLVDAGAEIDLVLTAEQKAQLAEGLRHRWAHC